MTEEIVKKYPWQLRVLGGILIFFAIRDYMSTGGTYAALRSAGVSHDDVWNFVAYPREASLYLLQHLVAVVAALALVALWSRSKLFPWAFSAYYVFLIAINVATIVTFNVFYGSTAPEGLVSNVEAAAVGAIIMHSILCVPWLLYLFMSPRARNVFCDSKPAQQTAQTDGA